VLIDRLLAKPGPDAQAALGLARRLAAARPEDVPLRLGVAERLLGALELDAVLTLLEPLLERSDVGARARFVAAEAHERRGERRAAQRLYEQILALDLDFPNARARAERLRPRPMVAATASAPTLLGVQDSQARTSRFQLLRELGRGSAATVYLARDTELERNLALKILHPQFYGPAHAAARGAFFAEARIAASIRHPGVIAIYDLDEARRLIAMEHCADGTLRDRLRQGPLPPATALELAHSLFETLAVVHARGVVHRDLKPGNLLWRSADAGLLVIADFGAAHLLAGDGGGRRAQAAGTLLYMAPEQRRGMADARADLYAAGAILYEMLTGQPPFSAADLLRDERATPSLPAVSLEALGAARPAVEALLASCLASDPEHRAPSGRSAAEAAARARATLSQK
jgi:serine/threonine-protein kinase